MANDTQHYDTLNNDSQHNGTQYNVYTELSILVMLNNHRDFVLSVIMLSKRLNISILTVIILNVIMLNVSMLNVSLC